MPYIPGPCVCMWGGNICTKVKIVFGLFALLFFFSNPESNMCVKVYMMEKYWVSQLTLKG